MVLSNPAKLLPTGYKIPSALNNVSGGGWMNKEGSGNLKRAWDISEHV